MTLLTLLKKFSIMVRSEGGTASNKEIYVLPQPLETDLETSKAAVEENHKIINTKSVLSSKTDSVLGHHSTWSGINIFYLPKRTRRENTSDTGFLPESILHETFDIMKFRNRFVQRVYTILSVQLLFTFAFLFLAIYVILYLFIVLLLIFCVNLRHRVPTNFILLSILTFSLTMVLSTISAYFKTPVVMYAVGTTAVVVFLVSIFAIQTKWDVTGYVMYLMVATGAFLICGSIVFIVYLCGIQEKILNIIFGGIGTLLFSMWLVFDTQRVVGNGRKNELAPEEYIFGALILYLDILIIFMLLTYLFKCCCSFN